MWLCVARGSTITPSFLRGSVLRSTGLISNNNLIPVLKTILALQDKILTYSKHQRKLS